MEVAAPDDLRWFNTLAVLAPDGTVLAHYDKHRLVPFGEYIPLNALAAGRHPRPDHADPGGFTPGRGRRS